MSPQVSTMDCERDVPRKKDLFSECPSWSTRCNRSFFIARGKLPGPLSSSGKYSGRSGQPAGRLQLRPAYRNQQSRARALTDLHSPASDYSIFVGVVGRITPKHPCATVRSFSGRPGQCLLHHKVKKILATACLIGTLGSRECGRNWHPDCRRSNGSGRQILQGGRLGDRRHIVGHYPA